MNTATVLVTQLTGQAWVRGSDGSLSAIRLGMRIPVDAEIVTASGSTLQLQADGMPPLTFGENQATVLTADLFMPPESSEAAVAPPTNAAATELIAAINAGLDPFEQLDPTAAVLTGGNDSGGTFVRLSSVLETTSPLGLAYPRPGSPNIDNQELGGVTAEEAPAPAPEPEPSDPTLVPGVSTIVLSADPRVTEGGKITVTATVSHAVTGSDLVIRLSDGTEITIPVGATSGTAQIDTRNDDAYLQGDETLQIGIDGTTGGNYENLDKSSTTSTTVGDDKDVTTVTLTSDAKATEGGKITVTASVNNAVTGKDLVITLNDGSTITIPVGQKTGSVEVDTRADDAYKQGEIPVDFAIQGTTGGNYENLNTDSKTSTTVKDDADVTTITLTSDAKATEGGKITVTASVNNAVTGKDLVITLNDGSTITIPVGQKTGSVEVDTRADDAYKQGEIPVDFAIQGTTGGNYENLNTDSKTSTTVKDDADVTTITLSSNDSVTEGGDIQVTAKVNNEVTGSDLVIDLGNGRFITIPVGETEGSITVSSREDDLYKQGETQVDFAIENVNGGNFESLNKDSTTSTTVVDDSDVVYAQISVVGQNPVAEGDPLTYKVQLVDKNGIPVEVPEGKSVTVKLDWSGAAANDSDTLGRPESVTIEGGKSEVEFTVNTKDDFVKESNEELTATITGVVDSQGVFENPQIHPENKTATGVITDNDSPPLLVAGTTRVSEEGLPDGNKDEEGDDATDLAKEKGSIGITHPHGTTVTLVLPGSDSGLKSGGLDVKWSLSNDGKTLTGSTSAGKVLTVTIDNQGKYEVELHRPLDHSDPTKEDVLDIAIGVKVDDAYGNSSSTTLTVKVEDDAPLAESQTHEMLVPVSRVEVSGFAAGFQNAKGGSLTQDNTDTDGYIDAIYWGGGNSPSGYTFKDNEALRTNGQGLVDSEFKIGTLTHINNPVSGTVLSTVDLVVDLTVMIDGVATVIKHKVSLKHTETDNNGTAAQNRDIIDLGDSGLTQTFVVGGRTFILRIKGFLDENGKMVTQIRTWEGQSTSFDLYAEIESTDDLPFKEGAVGELYNPGADGAAVGNSVVWNGATLKPDGSYEIVNEYGVFTGWSDGTYKFQLSRSARDELDVNEVKNLKFTYTVKDGDGDTATSDVNIKIQGEKNLPSVPVVEAAAEKLTIVNGEGSKQADLGIEVGRDVNGATIRIADANGVSLVGKAVQGTVVVDGKTHTVELTADGVPLVYRAGADGGLEAVKKGTNEVVFKVSGDAANGTYSVEMLQTVDQVTVQESASTSLSFEQKNGALKVTSKTGDFNITLSATSGSNVSTKAVWSNGQLGVDHPEANGSEDRKITGKNNEVLRFDFTLESGDKITSVLMKTSELLNGETAQYSINGGNWVTINGKRGSSPSLDISFSGGIDTIEIRAGSSSEFAITSVDVSYEKTSNASDVTLDFEAKVTDGTGDSVSNDFSVVIDQTHTVQGMAEEGVAVASMFEGDMPQGGEASSETQASARAFMHDAEASAGESLQGGAGDDVLTGGAGNDTLTGGPGNDMLIGGEGDDVFFWNAGDEGTAQAPAQDVVKDFGNGNDVLDLSDLLQGEESASDLSKFLHVDVLTEDGKTSTVINVSTIGKLDVDGNGFNQQITLDGVNWATMGDQEQLIKSLIAQGKLVMDGQH